MKLLKQASRKYKGTTYHKHWIVISNETITELGWNAGDELKSTTKDRKLIIEKDKK